MRIDVPFDLDFTLCCGQVFRWHKIDGWWYGIVERNVVKIRQYGGELEFGGVDFDFVTHYFGLDDDLAQISNCINRDAFIRKALHEFRGLRLIRQDPWECLVSYICATFKNIPAIGSMLNKLSEKFGEQTSFDGMTFYTYPSAEALANASIAELEKCSLGFRAKYLKAAAQKILDEKIQLKSLRALPYLDARDVLVEFPGVGLKVADCVLLFSLGKTEAFPVDVWVRRIILNHYADLLPAGLAAKISEQKSLSNGQYKKLNEWGRSYFGKYAGYAQEYLFHYERTQP